MFCAASDGRKLAVNVYWYGVTEFCGEFVAVNVTFTASGIAVVHTPVDPLVVHRTVGTVAIVFAIVADTGVVGAHVVRTIEVDAATKEYSAK